MLALNQSINAGIEYSIYTHVLLHMIKEKYSKVKVSVVTVMRIVDRSDVT